MSAIGEELKLVQIDTCKAEKARLMSLPECPSIPMYLKADKGSLVFELSCECVIICLCDQFFWGMCLMSAQITRIPFAAFMFLK